MKYKAGDKVRIKSIEWCKAHGKYLPSWVVPCAGRVLTIDIVYPQGYAVKEVRGMLFQDCMFEGLVEEEVLIERVDDNGLPFNEWLSYKGAFHVPDGYELKDENGNVINTQKIVLEKKKKEVILTQGQIDTMVHESCVLFCKHCGCGVPRDTCISLGTCKEYDDYRKHIRTHLEKHTK